VSGRHATLARLAAASLLSGAVVLGIGNPVALAATSSGAATVTVAPVPSGAVSVYSSVMLTAAIQPTTGPGAVVFSVDHDRLPPVPMVDGSATVTVPFESVGDHLVTATFLSAAADVAAVSSAPIVVTVLPQPKMWLALLSGERVPPGSELHAGQSVVAMFNGFTSDALVSFDLGGRPLPIAAQTNEFGLGSVRMTIPDTIAAGPYFFHAVVGDSTALFAFYVNRPAAPSPTPTAAVVPTPSPPTAAQPTPIIYSTTVPVTGAAPRTVTVGIPTSGATPALAHTGFDGETLVAASLLCLVLGSACLAGPRRGPAGRHSAQ